MAPLTRNKTNGNNKLRAKRSGNNKTPSIVQGKRKSGKVWKEQKKRVDSIPKGTNVVQKGMLKQIMSTLARALKHKSVAEETSTPLNAQLMRELELASERLTPRQISEQILNPKKRKVIKKRNRRTIRKCEDPPGA